ncbi:MAG: hypothetical protein LBQ00_02180 [Syntrophobacterales bacterium]|nr:hypothetical protein [Syntrophobacterales bacterium]
MLASGKPVLVVDTRTELNTAGTNTYQGHNPHAAGKGQDCHRPIPERKNMAIVFYCRGSG